MIHTKSDCEAVKSTSTDIHGQEFGVSFMGGVMAFLYDICKQLCRTCRSLCCPKATLRFSFLTAQACVCMCVCVCVCVCMCACVSVCVYDLILVVVNFSCLEQIFVIVLEHKHQIVAMLIRLTFIPLIQFPLLSL